MKLAFGRVQALPLVNAVLWKENLLTDEATISFRIGTQFSEGFIYPDGDLQARVIECIMHDLLAL